MFNRKTSSQARFAPALFMGTVLAAGFSVLPAATTSAHAAPSLSNTSWEIVGFGEQTLQFDGKGNIGGQAGCNNYSASYKVSGEGNSMSFSLGPVRATRKMCFRNSVMKQEKNFLEKLEKAKKLKLTEKKLQLMDAKGGVLATFVQK